MPADEKSTHIPDIHQTTAIGPLNYESAHAQRHRKVQKKTVTSAIISQKIVRTITTTPPMPRAPLSDPDATASYPAGALGHDSAPPCRKDGRRRMRSTAPRPYRRSPARQPETGGSRGRYGRRSREGALPPEGGRGACRPGRPVRPAPSWAPRRASRPASESRSCPRCSRSARCSPATSAAAVWRVRA